jgi:hypothetical protein
MDRIGEKRVNYFFLLCNLHPGTEYSVSLKTELENFSSDAVNIKSFNTSIIYLTGFIHKLFY